MFNEVLVADKLCKVYSGGVKALVDVSLRVHGRSITTLLGRNGAGKTTFVRISSTTLLPTRGSIQVLGHDVVKEPDKVRKRIAVMPQDARPLSYPKPLELIEAYLVMRGWGLREAKRRARWAAEVLELGPHVNKRVSELSGGLKRRVLMSMVLASGAELLFLDEPTIGLDPHSRRKIWATLRLMRKEGYTIFLTTHYMEEAEAISDEVVLIEKGRVIARGRVETLVSRIPFPYRIEVDSGFNPNELASFGRVLSYKGYHLVYTDEPGARELTRLAINRGLRVRVNKVGLEDVFLVMTSGE